jgi:LuxR family maltose regulon positive regulatory protein
LLDRLQSGSACTLTLISAPAGYGKTTLLSEWISQGDISFAWLSLDQHDNDLKRFLAYIIANLQSIQLEIDEQILNLYQSPSDLFTTILPPLENQISAEKQRFVLILDEYTLIRTQIIHQALKYLLDNLPQRMRLVIAARTDLLLRLAQFRACGELCKILSENLRFTHEEAIRFFNQSMKLSLTPSDIATLTYKSGYLIIGIDDDKRIVGVSEFEEERIQKNAYTYI